MALVLLPDGLVVDDWPLEAPCDILAVEFTSVELWFADVELLVVLLPLPMFTPGLTFAPRFTSVLLMPTFASTPTFGFTLRDRLPAFVSDEVALDGVELVEPETPDADPEPRDDEVDEPDRPDEEPDIPDDEPVAPAALPEGSVLPVPPVAVAFGVVYVPDVELLTVVLLTLDVLEPLAAVPPAVPFE